MAGASGARNAGWRSATSPLILFLDDDIVPGPDLVTHHLAWHERHPEREVGVLGHVRWSHRVKVTPFMRWLENGIQFDYGTIRSVEVEWQRFYSCNISVKREMLQLVGGFDEERFPYGYEDLELARRMSEFGFKLLYNRDAVAEHLKVESPETWRRNLRRIARAERAFTTLYPDEPAYFYDRFRAAAAAPPSRGRYARLARWVNPGDAVAGAAGVAKLRPRPDSATGPRVLGRMGSRSWCRSTALVVSSQGSGMVSTAGWVQARWPSWV